MKLTQSLFIVALISVVAACGSKSGSHAVPGTVNTGSSAARGNASAEEVAEEARKGLDCPARVRTAARDPQAPADDVVGVRPGLTYEEAANLVLCTNELLVLQPNAGRGVNIQTYGATLRQGFGARFAEPRVEKTSRQIMQEMQDEAIARGGNAVRHDMKPGQAKWYVGTMGLPGQERVISAAREEWYAEGKNPTIASVEQALVAKYGTPTRTMRSPGQLTLTWAHDPRGRLVTETSPLYNQCTGTASPDGGTNYNPDCGIVVMAIVVPVPSNDALARNIDVGVVDQAGGYQSITATEQALAAQESQRKAQQVQDASKNADKPTL
ncbi:MAG: hypothetical protein IPI06_12490 [Gammaproteobacteria bacterium]|nr:hypothetical protein [Gammaproteobacteria bacterium]